MAEIQFIHVSKVYGGDAQAVRDLSLEVNEGEFVVLVGPSGCGKPTALRMVAGLEEITEGEIRIGDRVVNDLAPRERDIAMVFQNYALYPHKTVYENLVFGLRMRKVPKEERRRRVEEIARILGLEEMLQRRPAHLSGGQRAGRRVGRGDGPGAAGIPDGRAAVQPGRQAASADAGGDRAHPADAAGDDAVCDARPGRGDDDGPPRRGHARRRAAAGRH